MEAAAQVGLFGIVSDPAIDGVEDSNDNTALSACRVTGTRMRPSNTLIALYCIPRAWTYGWERLNVIPVRSVCLCDCYCDSSPLEPAIDGFCILILQLQTILPVAC